MSLWSVVLEFKVLGFHFHMILSLFGIDMAFVHRQCRRKCPSVSAAMVDVLHLKIERENGEIEEGRDRERGEGRAKR